MRLPDNLQLSGSPGRTPTPLAVVARQAVSCEILALYPAAQRRTGKDQHMPKVHSLVAAGSSWRARTRARDTSAA